MALRHVRANMRPGGTAGLLCRCNRRYLVHDETIRVGLGIELKEELIRHIKMFRPPAI